MREAPYFLLVPSWVDYSVEPMTLVELRLEEVEGGTLLTVVESGFDEIPLLRRAKAFEMNEGGWAAQLENIERQASAGEVLPSMPMSDAAKILDEGMKLPESERRTLALRILDTVGDEAFR